MPASRLMRAAPFALAATLLLAGSSSAAAGDKRQQDARAAAVLPLVSDAPLAQPSPISGLLGSSAFSPLGQHGSISEHLPAVRENVQLVSKLEMNTPPEFRTPETADQPVLPGQIADLAVYKNFAYLNSWSEPTCRRGGIFVVDISNPAAPQQVRFLPASPNTRHGEGAHVITIRTPSGPMDVLAVNNEPLPPPCDQTLPHAGGFDLWNVTDPRNPELLARNVGDTGPDDGSLVGDPPEPVHQSHSTFMWQNDQGRAFVVFTDNTEDHDVDIFEITNPREPRPVAEFDLKVRFPQVRDNSALGDLIYHHDVVVKKINGVWTMLVDYWDAGYVTLNVDNPANPQYIGDTSFDGPDPLMPEFEPPEGNAHQAEFSHDNRWILAADEDFGAYRFQGEITDGPNQGFRFFEAGVPDEGPIVTPETPIVGDTRFIGQACDPAAIPPATPEVTIAVAERGVCGFQVKTENAEAQGYTSIIIFNNAAGLNAQCDELLNMDFTNYTGDMYAMFVGRSVGFRIIDAYDPATYECTDGDESQSTPVPAAPREGSPIDLSVLFDGWGYTHLYENGPGKMRRVDSFAIEEALDERYAIGFGDLSVHEFATDPTENVAYSSYYAGGMRVFTFGPDGLTQQGKFIDDGGSNFWGVEQFTASDGQRYFAGSDRDFGLYILRYTGPGAAARPVCTDSVTMVPFKGSASVALSCSDANGNPLTRAVTAQPTAGTLGSVGETVSYTHTGNTLGNADQFQFTANDGAATSAPATARIVTVPREGGRCFNPFAGTAARETITGSPFGDRITGGDGNDTLNGRGGVDCLSGEGGADRLSGGAGGDELRGGSGGDRVEGGSGGDRGNGGSGNDRARLGSGNDRYSGGGGRDRLDGGSGRDRLSGGGGNDQLDAGSGRNNRLSGGGGRDTVLAKNGARDRITCGGGRDSVRADRRDRVARDCERVRRR